MELTFYRHPTPDAAPGMCYGRLDLGVGPTGPDEIVDACANPPKVSQIISSPAQRARALAEPLAVSSGAPLITDERLWEMDMGRWEGMLWSDIDRAESDPWAADALNHPTPDGEAFTQVIKRVGAVLETLQTPSCIVAHAGPIRAARMILTDASFDEVFADPVPYATPITFQKGRWNG